MKFHSIYFFSALFLSLNYHANQASTGERTTNYDTLRLMQQYEAAIKTSAIRPTFLDSIISISQSSHFRRLEGKALYSLGSYYILRGAEETGFNYCWKSYQIAKEINSKQDMLNPLLRISRHFYIKNEIEKALGYCYTGLKIAEQIHDTLNIANFYLQASECYFSVNEVNKSIALDLKCLHLYRLIHNARGIAHSFLSLGTDYRALGNDALASGYYLQCKQYVNEFSGDFYININNAVGGAYGINGQYDSSFKYSQRAYLAALKLKNNILIVSTMVTIGWVNLWKGDLVKAKSISEEALAISKTTDFQLQIPELTDLLRRIYLKTGDYKKALEVTDLNMIARDSLSNKNVKRKAMEKEFSYNLEKKEAENKLLSQQSKIRLQQLFGMLAFTGFIIVIGWLLFRQYRLKNKHKSMQLEQKLLLSQMNPHFIFNSLQAIHYYILKEDKLYAEKYIGSFAGIMRDVLESSRMELVSLKKEITLLENYLQLQKLRFNNQFDYLIKVDERLDAEQISLPPMLAQPFVENAVEHGFRGIKSGCKVDVAYVLENNYLIMTITDNGVGIKKPQPVSNTHRSFGIQIAKERIALLNKKNKGKVTLDITEAFPEEAERKGVKVRFQLPLGLRV